MSNIAWIGLGHMGIPMSKHFVDAGHIVHGVDLDDGARTRANENGVEVGFSVAEAVRDADIVCTMLPSAKQVTAVLTGPDGAFAHMPERSVAVDFSTTGIDTAERLAELAIQSGVGFVDAPVSGGVQGAERGDLALMLGGEVDHVLAVEPFTKLVGDYIVHVGPSGRGQAMKVVNNAMMGVAMAVSCEASVLAQRLGLDIGVFYNMVLRSSGDNWAFRNWFPLPDVVPTSPSSHGYEAGFMVDLVAKDLRLAVELGGEHDVEMATSQTAMELFQRTSAEGAGRRDLTSLALYLGAKVESPVAG